MCFVFVGFFTFMQIPRGEFLEKGQAALRVEGVLCDEEYTRSVVINSWQFGSDSRHTAAIVGILFGKNDFLALSCFALSPFVS